MQDRIGLTLESQGHIGANVVRPGSKVGIHIGSMEGEGHAILVVVGLLGATRVGIGHPVGRADEGAFAEDSVTALLLAVGILAHLEVVSTGDAVGLVKGSGGASESGVGVRREDGGNLGGGEIGELQGEPGLEVVLGGDGVGNEESAFVGNILQRVKLANNKRRTNWHVWRHTPTRRRSPLTFFCDSCCDARVVMYALSVTG